MKRFSILAILVVAEILCAGKAEAQVKAYNAVGVNVLAVKSGFGFHLNGGLVEFGDYFGETNSTVTSNSAWWTSVNWGIWYGLEDFKYVLVSPKIGMGWYSGEVAYKVDKSTERIKTECLYLNIHPQIMIRPIDKIGINLGYLYQALKFKFEGSGCFTIGLSYFL